MKRSFLLSFPHWPRLISSLQVLQLCISRNISGFISQYHSSSFFWSTLHGKALFFPREEFLWDCCWMWSVLDNSKAFWSDLGQSHSRDWLWQEKMKALLKLVHVTRSSLYIKSFEAGHAFELRKITSVLVFKETVHSKQHSVSITRPHVGPNPYMLLFHFMGNKLNFNYICT